MTISIGTICKVRPYHPLVSEQHDFCVLHPQHKQLHSPSHGDDCDQHGEAKPAQSHALDICGKCIACVAPPSVGCDQRPSTFDLVTGERLAVL